jgi:hypothetical protein
MQGRVVGVDMTEEQLQCANSHLEYHAKALIYLYMDISPTLTWITTARP